MCISLSIYLWLIQSLFSNLDPENVEERAPGKLSLPDRAIAIADEFMITGGNRVYCLSSVISTPL